MRRSRFNPDPGVNAMMRKAAILRGAKQTAAGLVAMAELAAHQQDISFGGVVCDELDARRVPNAIGKTESVAIERHLAAIATDSEAVLPLLQELMRLNPKAAGNGNGMVARRAGESARL
jgi:hypothetical protein